MYFCLLSQTDVFILGTVMRRISKIHVPLSKLYHAVLDSKNQICFPSATFRIAYLIYSFINGWRLF